jgi:hypothetical protein
MRIRGLTLWLTLLGGLAACDNSRSGSITVGWTFGGGSCSGAAVEQVQIAIAGEQVSPNTFDCRSGLVTFQDFFPGNYVVTIQGLDSTQAVTWTGSKSFRVDGDVNVTVDLQPVSQENAVSYFSWTFDPATGDPGQIPLCGQGQRLDRVGILIDGTDNGSFGCEQGLNGNVVITPYVTPGKHSIDLVAYSSQEGVTRFAETGTFDINFVTGTATSQTVALHWNVGGLAMTWAAYPSLAAYQASPNQPLTCASTGIASVSVFLANPSDTSKGTQFTGFTCASGALLDNAPAGQWLPFVAGYASGGSTPIYFQDEQNVPQTVTVTAGHFFATQDSQTQVFVPLFP